MSQREQATPAPQVLDAWLTAVSSSLDELRNTPRASRRRLRDKSRARREARELFDEYYRRIGSAFEVAA